MYTAAEIRSILNPDWYQLVAPDLKPEYLVTDSRSIDYPVLSLFFAISGTLHDGHNYIDDVIAKGVRNIIAEHQIKNIPSGVNYFVVTDSKKALQQLVVHHRQQYKAIQVIGITGSNGKTTVKEWLGELLADRSVVKSPKSYNSQIGVPLSVWQIREVHQWGIFEAGISKHGEMAVLRDIIQPHIGIFTNIGDAHAEGFVDLNDKLMEKLLLFRHSDCIIFNEDESVVAATIRKIYPEKKLLSWGSSKASTIFRIITTEKRVGGSVLQIACKEKIVTMTIPFADNASLSNIGHCIALMLLLGYSQEVIQERIMGLHNIAMRLEMKSGIRDCVIINDSYNADLQSLKIALEFQAQQAGNRDKMLIISDFYQTGLDEKELNMRIAHLMQLHKLSDVIAVGRQISAIEPFMDPFILFRRFADTDALLTHLNEMNIDHKIILVKGARKFELEKVVEQLTARKHSATLETDLQALGANLRYFSDRLSTGTGLIAVIKAAGYGSGSIELAKFLEFSKVSFLAVAFADEGVELRKAGIRLPIMVLNPESGSIRDMIRYNLEPEVYAPDQLAEILQVMNTEQVSRFGIHLKLDTGMHRLGFDENEIDELLNLLSDQSLIEVRSIFSHLSSSEDPGDDSFTHLQADLFLKMYHKITGAIGYHPLKHLLNTAGILRFPLYHFDMVRLGLGMYGIDVTGKEKEHLEKVHTLTARVLQIKQLNKGDAVGYNRKELMDEDGYTATINIGYADGLLRNSGNRKYSVRINGIDYPVIGNVCMDLIIVLLGKHHDVKVGDDVVIFGKDKPIEILAEVNHTIPYEILSRISPRIKRVYIQG